MRVDCECYVNLLKHFQEGKVHVCKVTTPEQRLTNIKEKIISRSLFEKFYTEGEQVDKNVSKLAQQEVRTAESGEVPSEESSQDDTDDADTDPDYKPDVQDVEEETGKTPTKCRKTKGSNYFHI